MDSLTGTSSMAEVGLSHWADYLALVLYLLLTFAVAVWSMCRPTRKSVKGYFLAGGSASWWPVGLSLFASNVSSEHFIGMAGAGAASGLAVVLFEWNAIFLLLLLAWMFIPVYLISGVYTLPEYLQRRYGGSRLRLMMSIIFILSYVIMPADLYTGGLFIEQALGWNIYIGVFAIMMLAAIYSVMGGLSTVLYTDAIQVFIMLIGAAALSVIGFIKVGGMGGLKEKYAIAIADDIVNATNVTCGRPRSDAWHLFRHPLTSDYPSVAVMLRLLLGGIYYWCASQTMVQRVLAAKNVSHAKAGVLLAGFLKITPLFLMVMPGMISRALYPNVIACATPESCIKKCGSPTGCSNLAYPYLVLEALPFGMRGLMIAVMLSAVISSLTSIYNSVATVITLDIWRKLRPRAGQRELLIAGRVSCGLIIGVSVAWIPVVQTAEGGQFLKYGLAVVGYLGAPLSSTFLVAMFWPRSNEKGAFWGFVAATVPGFVRLGLDTAYRKPPCGQPDLRPAFVAEVHPFYFTALQIVFGMIVNVVISLLTKPLPKEQLAGVTFWTRYQQPARYAEVQNNGIEMAAHTSPQEQSESKGLRSDDTSSGVELHPADEEAPSKSHSRIGMCLNRFCGLNEAEKDSALVTESYEHRRGRLKEKKVHTIILNIGAVCLVAIVIGLFIYFG